MGAAEVAVVVPGALVVAGASVVVVSLDLSLPEHAATANPRTTSSTEDFRSETVDVDTSPEDFRPRGRELPKASSIAPTLRLRHGQAVANPVSRQRFTRLGITRVR